MKKRAETGAWISISAYLFLCTTKIALGHALMSEALTADGWNNVTDVLTSVAVLIGLRISRKPRDQNHPYGHSRAESVSALLGSFIMATIAFDVLKSALQTAWSGPPSPPDIFAFWTALTGAGVMLIVFGYNRWLAHQTGSRALQAASKDNLSDTLVSLGAAVGILGSQFGLPWLDPAAAVLVGLLILWTAWNIFSDESHLLTDGFHERELARYRRTMESIAGVRFVVDLKGRHDGHQVILDAVIEVDPSLNVEESHRITEELEWVMWREHQVKETLIHVEPAQKNRHHA